MHLQLCLWLAAYVNGWLTQVTAKYDDNYLVNE